MTTTAAIWAENYSMLLEEMTKLGRSDGTKNKIKTDIDKIMTRLQNAVADDRDSMNTMAQKINAGIAEVRSRDQTLAAIAAEGTANEAWHYFSGLDTHAASAIAS